MLIIDEIDANLDEHVGEVINRILDEFKGTILMVTRSEMRLALAEYLWFIDQGKLIRIEDRRPTLARMKRSAEAGISTI